MTAHTDYLDALDELARLPERLAVDISRTNEKHAAKVAQAQLMVERSIVQASELTKLAEDALQRGRSALSPIDLTDVVPRKVRGTTPARSAEQVASSAAADLDAAIRTVVAAVNGVERHRDDSKQRRRQAFLDEKRRKEDEERRRREAALAAERRRQLIIRAGSIAAVVLVVIVLILLLS